MNCTICKTPMNGPHRGYWFLCPQCGFLASSLSPSIGDLTNDNAIDEMRRREALDDLRHLNFERVLDVLDGLAVSQPKRLLDVGCAHGWFLQAAAKRGYLATGVEPDPVIANQARRNGLSVIPGFFPQDIPADEVFDVISFHDVLEHLPSLQEAATACFERLSPSGLLVIVLPSSEGFLFRLAQHLSQLGLHGPLDRLWQRGFPSPHLSYFHPGALESLLVPHGFREVHRGTLASFTRKGLWQRLTYDRRSSRIISCIQWLALSLLSPLQAFLPADISFQIFRRDTVNPPVGV